MFHYGRRIDSVQFRLNQALNACRLLRLANENPASDKSKAAQAELEAARQAIRDRDAERKATRAKNKELRAQGIDPNKKPEAMTVEEFEHARKTLRAAIQPQFAAYKAQLFKVLRADVDGWLEKLEQFGGDARAASFNGEDVRVVSEMERTAQDRSVREIARNKLERGAAWLQHIRHWTTPLPVAEGEHNDINRLGAKERRAPRSDESIDKELDATAHAMTERDFDSYTQKLAGKIGLAIDRATVLGNLWSNSILVAHIEAGFWNESQRQPVQRWSTKMILNRSVLGTLFNQWPTRRCDKGAK